MNSQFNIPASTNPYDYLVFDDANGKLYALELKSTKYKSIGFQLTPDQPDAMIHAHQIKGLYEAQKDRKNVKAGFILQFRGEEITYYMDINDFIRFTEEVDRKSITPLLIVQYGGKVLDQKMMRTHYAYNVKKLLDEIKERK